MVWQSSFYSLYGVLTWLLSILTCFPVQVFGFLFTVRLGYFCHQIIWYFHLPYHIVATGTSAHIPFLRQRLDLHLAKCPAQKWRRPGNRWISQDCCVRLKVTNSVKQFLILCIWGVMGYLDIPIGDRVWKISGVRIRVCIF